MGKKRFLMTGKIYFRRARFFLPDIGQAIILLFVFFCMSGSGLRAQNFYKDGILNGKDDIEFAKSLAAWGYDELAKDVSEQICKYASDPAERESGKRLRCTLFQISAQQETDLDKKDRLYRKATSCYKNLVKQAKTDAQRWALEREMAGLYMQQGEELVYHAKYIADQNQEEYYRKALPLFESAYEQYDFLKKETDDAGSDLESRGASDTKDRLGKAEIRYVAWYGVCRALYFQGVCGNLTSLGSCMDEIDNYLWEYEGTLGSYHAMILRGRALCEQKNYSDATISFDGVLKPLLMYASLEITPNAQSGSAMQIFERKSKWLQETVGLYLFSLDIGQSLSLDSGKLDEAIRFAFQKKRRKLSEKSVLRVAIAGQKWIIEDRAKNQEYTIVKKARELKIYGGFSDGAGLLQLAHILKDEHQIELIFHPEILQKDYTYRARGRVTVKAMLSQIVRELNAGICETGYPETKALCMEACYQKIHTLIAWKKFQKAVEVGKNYQRYYQDKFQASLDRENSGQIILLEMGQAYLGLREYDKAMKLAEKIAGKNGFWGFVAQRYLQKWVTLNPESVSAESMYKVAIGEWREEKNLQAILHFLKVIEYAKTREEVQLYALDASEKLAQSYWFLGLYLESASAYELCARRLIDDPLYKECKKVTKSEKGQREVDIGAKCAYWAYSGYRQSYKITGDPVDKKKYEEIRALLITYPAWKDTPYAQNPTFFAAQDREDQAKALASKAKEARERAKQAKDDAKEKIEQEMVSYLDQAIKIYYDAAEKYKNVSKKADLYESALVAVGKCYYKAAELGIEKPGVDKDNLNTWPSTVTDDYRRARDELDKYYKKYRKKVKKLKGEDRERRTKALAESLFFMGQIYSQLGKMDKARDAWKTIYKKYPQQQDMVISAVYLLIEYEISHGSLEQAEKYLKNMEKRIGKAGSSTAKEYRGFCYFLVGRKYLENAENAEKSSEMNIKIVEDYRSACKYLWKWRQGQQDINYVNADWLATKYMHFGKLLFDFNQPEGAEQWYGRAFNLFERCSAIAMDSERESIDRKLVTCAVEIKNWEKAAYKLYPIYHKDLIRRKQLRAKNKGTPPKSQLYLQYMMRTLKGIAMGKPANDPEKLYALLLRHANRDLMFDLEEAGVDDLKHTTGQFMYERYVNLQEIAARVNQLPFGQAQKEKLLAEFTQQKKSKNEKSLKSEYYDRCEELIASEFPREGAGEAAAAIPANKRNAYVKRLSLELAYLFATELVSKMPRYAPRLRKLFELDKKYIENLNACLKDGKVSKSIHEEFAKQRKKLSSKAKIRLRGNKWVINDKRKGKRREYRVKQAGDSLDVYRKRSDTLLYYDNPNWWEAKLCQLECVYRRGDAKKAKDMIEILELQQPRLGGQKYQRKFKKLKKKTSSSE